MIDGLTFVHKAGIAINFRNTLDHSLSNRQRCNGIMRNVVLKTYSRGNAINSFVTLMKLIERNFVDDIGSQNQRERKTNREPDCVDGDIGQKVFC